MNREFLKERGLTDEQIEAVMKEHGKTLNETKTKADGLEGQIEDLEGQIEQRDNQLNDLKDVDAEGLQQRIQELEEANETTKTEYETRLRAQQKDFAVESAFRDAKARDPKVAMKAFSEELEDVTLKDGKLLGFDDRLKSWRESHDYLFEQAEQQEQNQPGFKVGGDGQGNATPPTEAQQWVDAFK